MKKLLPSLLLVLAVVGTVLPWTVISTGLTGQVDQSIDGWPTGDISQSYDVDQSGAFVRTMGLDTNVGFVVGACTVLLVIVVSSNSRRVLWVGALALAVGSLWHFSHVSDLNGVMGGSFEFDSGPQGELYGGPSGAIAFDSNVSGSVSTAVSVGWGYWVTLASLLGAAGVLFAGRRDGDPGEPAATASVSSARPRARARTHVDAQVDARIERLSALGDLRDRGVLTDEEFAREKESVLRGGRTTAPPATDESGSTGVVVPAPVPTLDTAPDHTERDVGMSLPPVRSAVGSGSISKRKWATYVAAAVVLMTLVLWVATRTPSATGQSPNGARDVDESEPRMEAPVLVPLSVGNEWVYEGEDYEDSYIAEYRVVSKSESLEGAYNVEATLKWSRLGEDTRYEVWVNDPGYGFISYLDGVEQRSYPYLDGEPRKGGEWTDIERGTASVDGVLYPTFCYSYSTDTHDPRVCFVRGIGKVSLGEDKLVRFTVSD